MVPVLDKWPKNLGFWLYSMYQLTCWSVTEVFALISIATTVFQLL